ncbi:hypothetical protein R6Q57_018245 [Mikania cordata]
MLGSWKHKFLVLCFITSLAFSEATSRFPKDISWEQMMPKKFPSPSSAPSKGTNSLTNSHTTLEAVKILPSDDGKV